MLLQKLSVVWQKVKKSQKSSKRNFESVLQKMKKADPKFETKLKKMKEIQLAKQEFCILQGCSNKNLIKPAE